MEFFTLEGVQADYDRFGHLSQEDINYANQLLIEGKDFQFVVSCIRSWVRNYEHTFICETKEASRFQQWSY